MHLSRRALIAASAALGHFSSLWRLGDQDAEEPRGRLAGRDGAGPAPWFDISLAQWSNHRSLHAGELSNLDWISGVRKKYGITAIEFVNQFFMDKACDWGYLTEMKQRAADGGTRMLLIMIDGEGALAAEPEVERQRAIANHRKWVVAASFLGCHSIRVNAAGSGEPSEMQKRAADSLVQLADYGDAYGINILVENHGGQSSDGQWLAGVMKLAGHPRVGTLPDFGNFQTGPDTWYDRYQGVRELMPFAKAVSAKSHEFDEAGNEVHTDFQAMLQIVHDAGYRGRVGIEYEGSKHTENEGIRLTHQLLKRVREAIS